MEIARAPAVTLVEGNEEVGGVGQERRGDQREPRPPLVAQAVRAERRGRQERRRRPEPELPQVRELSGGRAAFREPAGYQPDAAQDGITKLDRRGLGERAGGRAGDEVL